MELEKLKNELSSVCVILFTPFDDEDEIDEDGYRQNISFLIEKSKGHTEKLIFVAGGSLGEFYALTEDELKKIIKIAVDEVGGKAIVIAGTAHSGTKPSLKMSQYAKDVGADGVLVVLPYYHIPSWEGMYQHYKTIASGLDIGVIVYNNPDTTKAYINPELMPRIVDIPNVIGIKENSTNLATIRKIMKLDHEGKARVIGGKGEFLYAACIPFGMSGFVSSYANFYPEFSLDLLKVGKMGDVKAAWKLIEEKFMPLQDFVDEVTKKRKSISSAPQLTSLYAYLAVRKAVMPLIGLSGSGKTRLPIIPITEEEKEKLKDVIEVMGLPLVR